MARRDAATAPCAAVTAAPREPPREEMSLGPRVTWHFLSLSYFLSKVKGGWGGGGRKKIIITSHTPSQPPRCVSPRAFPLPVLAPAVAALGAMEPCGCPITTSPPQVMGCEPPPRPLGCWGGVLPSGEWGGGGFVSCWGECEVLAGCWGLGGRCWGGLWTHRWWWRDSPCQGWCGVGYAGTG